MTRNYLDILAETIRNNWDRPALTDFYLTEDGTAQDTSRGNHYTYGEMYIEMLRLCELFRSIGLKKGDHIAICGANSAHWAIAYLAIAAYQGVAVTVLHSQPTEDIARQIDFSDAKALFTDRDLWEELKSHSLLQVENIIFLDNFESGDSRISRASRVSIMFRKSSPSTVTLPNGTPDELAMICFTSGSTSSSKGIMLSNRNISNNAKNITDGYPNGEITAFLSVLPMAHIYGFMTEILAQLLKGKYVYILSGIMSLGNLRSAIKLTRPYALSLIPFLVSGLIREHQDCISLLKACRQIYIGGSLFDNVLELKLLEAKVPISIGYGMTETGPLISYSICSEYKTGTCGKIVEGMTARIAENGEILVKGENVMLGYYKDPEATARKIDADGWLHTGDRGHLDEEGYLYVEGRLEHDMIVLPNGENIHPEDIENKINAMPEVAESIVVARNGQLTAIVRLENLDNLEHLEHLEHLETLKQLRLTILRTINPQLPLYSQLYDICFSDKPLARTEKQTLKRYLYK